MAAVAASVAEASAAEPVPAAVALVVAAVVVDLAVVAAVVVDLVVVAAAAVAAVASMEVVAADAANRRDSTKGKPVCFGRRAFLLFWILPLRRSAQRQFCQSVGDTLGGGGMCLGMGCSRHGDEPLRTLKQIDQRVQQSTRYIQI